MSRSAGCGGRARRRTGEQALLAITGRCGAVSPEYRAGARSGDRPWDSRPAYLRPSCAGAPPGRENASGYSADFCRVVPMDTASRCARFVAAPDTLRSTQIGDAVFCRASVETDYWRIGMLAVGTSAQPCVQVHEGCAHIRRDVSWASKVRRCRWLNPRASSPHRHQRQAAPTERVGWSRESWRSARLADGGNQHDGVTRRRRVVFAGDPGISRQRSLRACRGCRWGNLRRHYRDIRPRCGRHNDVGR